MEVALRLAALPGLASGLSIHHELLPAPSFWTRMKRLCSDRLCRIEFCEANEPGVKLCASPGAQRELP